MVHENNDELEEDVETINEEETDTEETELQDEEAQAKDKIKQLRAQLASCDEERKRLLEESQRARADFLNARKRLEEDRARDHVRARKQHVEELLPLCDSFEMAMKDKDAWEKADPAWRKGMEGVHTQLSRLLASYGVTVIDPVGELFNPHRDEAIGTEAVTDEKLVDTVVSVMQRGYEIKVGDETEIIRHARVTTGVWKE